MPNPNAVRAQGAAGGFPGYADPLAAMLPPELAGLRKDFFVVVCSGAVAAGATTPLSAQVDQDSTFVIRMLAGVVVDTATQLVFTNMLNVPALITIQDSSSNYGWQGTGQSIHPSAIFGTAQQPLILPYPKIVRGGTNVTVQTNNQSAASLTFRWHFIGFKVWNYLPQGGGVGV